MKNVKIDKPKLSAKIVRANAAASKPVAKTFECSLHYKRIWGAKNNVERWGAVVQFLADAPSVDTPIEQEFTALMLCSMKNDQKSMEKLLAAGASVHARSGAEQTALMLAAVCDAKEGVRLLLRHGSDAKAVDSDGDDVLERGLMSRMDILQDLVEAGANPRKKCRGKSRRKSLEDKSWIMYGSRYLDINNAAKIDALDAFYEKVEIKNVLALNPKGGVEKYPAERKSFRL